MPPFHGWLRLTEEERFDCLLIESTGISEPLPVAAASDFRDEAGYSLGNIAQIETMATVVDAANILNFICMRIFYSITKRASGKRSTPAGPASGRSG